METNIASRLLDIALQEAASKEAELQSLRNSLRYRVGGWMLEAFPLGRSTLVAAWRLIRLYVALRHGRGAANKLLAQLALPEESLRASTLVLGTAVPVAIQGADNLWHTTSAELMALRLDSGASAETLIVRVPDGMALRRIARARLQGTKVIWWPESSTVADPALISYIRTHADECRVADSV